MQQRQKLLTTPCLKKQKRRKTLGYLHLHLATSILTDLMDSQRMSKLKIRKVLTCMGMTVRMPWSASTLRGTNSTFWLHLAATVTNRNAARVTS
jgi:hypothetical protein